jgi:hypothetical protein
MQRYRTDYPNQVHLLSVSVSKHWWISKDGTLKYQKKPFEVSLTSVNSSSKTHVVFFGLRDHCSGVLYCDVASADEVPPLADFLFRAWSPKADLSFRGMPELLGVPKTVRSAFPGVPSVLEPLGVSLCDVTSGFQGGAGMTKSAESWISLEFEKPFSVAIARIKQLPAVLAKEKGRTGDRTKLAMWESGVPDRLLDGPPETWLAGARQKTTFVPSKAI